MNQIDMDPKDLYEMLVKARSEVRQAFWDNLKVMRETHAPTEAFDRLLDETSFVLSELTKRINAIPVNRRQK